MRLRSTIRLLTGCGLLVCCTGCLFTRHSTRVVREDEKLCPVRFESPEAQEAFNARLAEMKERGEGDKGQFAAIPFLLWYCRNDVLSDNARFNDQAAICDANRDGVIALREAEAYMAKSRAAGANSTSFHAEAKSTKTPSAGVALAEQPASR